MPQFDGPNLTQPFLRSTVALGRGTDAVGSGLLLRLGEDNYLFTAKHVADSCENQPTIFRNGNWNRPPTPSWRVVASDDALDVCVLTTDWLGNMISLPLGAQGAILGTSAIALGFPAHVDAADFEGYPLPVPAILATYWNPQTDCCRISGYINSGFSGGPVLFATQAMTSLNTNLSVAGIITGRVHVWRRVFHNNGTPSEFKVQEPSGILQFTTIRAILRVLGESLGKDMSGYAT